MQRLFSGIQPSGNLHLGNYLGAIRQWLTLQDEYEVILSVVDLHAITVPQDPAELRKKTIEVARIYLAAGIDPEKATIFAQSQVSGHTQLAWILNTIATMGELGRMTQFKDKTSIEFDQNKRISQRELASKASVESNKETMSVSGNSNRALAAEAYKRREKIDSIGVGLFDYPVLMAADILLYDTTVVPVGEDQKQHVELTRDLALRFNKRFGETFVIPKPLIQTEGARIMGLDDPTKKMSKSATSEYNYIALTDEAAVVRKKIMKAVTDSGSEVVYADDKPALKNLLNIYSLLTDKKPEEIAGEYVGKGYADFKKDLAEVIVNFLTPFQERMEALSDEEVLRILEEGKKRIQPITVEKMRQVYDKVGLISY
ncbi:MAG: tryptophan--tRNA ligase [Candidatus Moraniibacteriota bacterium]